MKDTGFRIGPEQRQRLAKVPLRTAAAFECPTQGQECRGAGVDMGGGGMPIRLCWRIPAFRPAHDVVNGGVLDRDAGRYSKNGTVRRAVAANAMGDGRCRPMKAVVTGGVERCRRRRWHAVGAGRIPDQSRSAADGPIGWLAGLGGLANSYFWTSTRPGGWPSSSNPVAATSSTRGR